MITCQAFYVEFLGQVRYNNNDSVFLSFLSIAFCPYTFSQCKNLQSPNNKITVLGSSDCQLANDLIIVVMTSFQSRLVITIKGQAKARIFTRLSDGIITMLERTLGFNNSDFSYPYIQ